MIEFFVDGTPVPKGRPIASTFGGRVSMRTPEKTKAYEHVIGWNFRQNFPDHDIIRGPVSVEVVAFYFPPKANQKKKLALMPMPKTTTPDLDNVVKAVLDGLNKIAYVDDSLVYETRSVKLYSTESEGLLIRIREYVQGVL
jgi:Holliday junction resolvase RusA-like endonuclease